MRKTTCLFCLLLVAVGGDTARGYIEAMYSLQQVLEQSTHILVGKVEKVDSKSRLMTASIGRALKGNLDFKSIQMNVNTGIAGQPEYLIERARPGGEIIFFYQRGGNSIACEAHTADTWFQLYCQDNPANRQAVWWTMSHIEIKLGRTFNGTTEELIKLTEDVLAKRVPPPPPDPKVQPLDWTARRVSLSGEGKGGGFHSQVQFKYPGGEAGGVALADVNRDGLPDILACRQQANVLLVSQHGGFEDQTTRLGMAGGSRSGAWGDYNGDGLPDLLTGGFQLFTNAAGRVRDDSQLLPSTPQRHPQSAGGWIDFDGDGLPDILVANGPFGLCLFRNAGKGPNWFADVSAKAGLGPKGPGAGAAGFLAFFDYDGDGFSDVLVNVGGGLLLHNDGNGTFRPDATTGIELPGPPGYPRGVAVGDFNNDGNLDLFVPGPARPRLYRNNNDGTFTDVVESAGDLARLGDPSASGAWADVNGDGCLDLLVCCNKATSHLYLGDGGGKFTEVTEQVGLKGLAPALAACFADLNDDGRPDLVVSQPDRVMLAVNQIPLPSGRGAVSVRVQARRGMTGAVVRALEASGRPLGRRELNGAEGYGGQSCPVANFALPEGKCVISVCLSDGRAAFKTVEVGAKHAKATFTEEDFQQPSTASAPAGARAGGPASASPPQSNK